MIALLLLFLALGSSHDLPKISYLIVSSSFSEKDMEDIEDWKDHINDLVDDCEDDKVNFSPDQRDQCEDYFDSISSIILSNGKDINEKLKKVSKKTEYLFYITHTRHINVDLNNLPAKMVVYMLPFDFSQHKNIKDIGNSIYQLTKKLIRSSFDGSPESNKKLSQLIAHEVYSHQKTEVLIEGSIKNKVSFLTISHMRVVYNNEFQCENVYLSSGVLVSMTNNKALVKNFMIDTETFSYYSILPYLVTDQFTLVDFNEDNSSIPEYQIAYYDFFWGIQCIYNGNFIHNRYHWKVPFYVTKKFAIICHSRHLIIEAVNTSLEDYPDVNITVTNNGLIDSEEKTLSGLDKIAIESIGFDAVNKDVWPSIVVTYNKNKFTLDKSKSDLDVSGEQIFGNDDKTKSHKAKVGMIVGIVFGVVALIAIIVVVVIVVKKKNENRESVRIYENKLLANDQNQLNDNSFHDPSPNSNNQQA